VEDVAMKKTMYLFIGIVLMLMMVPLTPLCSATMEKTVVSSQPVKPQQPLNGGIVLNVQGGNAFTVKITNTKKILPVVMVGWAITIIGKNSSEFGVSGTLYIKPGETTTIFSMPAAEFQKGTYGFLVEVFHPKIGISGKPSLKWIGVAGTIVADGSTVTVKKIPYTTTPQTPQQQMVADNINIMSTKTV